MTTALASVVGTSPFAGHHLLSSAAVVCSSRNGANGRASALSFSVPVETVGAFRMLFLLVNIHHPIVLDAGVGAYDDGDRGSALAAAALWTD